MRSSSCVTVFRRLATIVLFLSAAVSPAPSSADCDWPPLEAVEQRESHPVQVGDYVFTTGFYSYWVASYRINALRCQDSINTGPRQWSAIIGLGGEEPIGPRTSPSPNTSSAPSGPTTLSEYTARPQSLLPPLPALPSLPVVPRELPPLPSVTPLPSPPSLKALPLPPLPPLPQP
jgi:hypothetical protein